MCLDPATMMLISTGLSVGGSVMQANYNSAVSRNRAITAQHMQKVADEEGAKLTIQPWDYRYYAEKVRKEKYDLD